MSLESRRVPLSLFLTFLLHRPRALSVGLLLGVVPTILILVINGLMGSMDGQGPDRRRIAKEGRVVVARVIKSAPVSNITIENRNPLRITYTYKWEGQDVEDVIETLDRDAERLESGKEVKALAVEGDSMLPNFSPVHFPLWAMGVIGGIFLLMGAPFLFYAISGAFSCYTLYRFGELLSGTVDVYGTSYTLFFTPRRVKVSYTALLPSGEALKSSSVVVDDGSWRDKPRGARLAVLCFEGKSCAVEEGLWSKCGEKR